MALCVLGGDPNLQAIIQGTLFRVVESQEQVATSSLVDNLAEQAQLEEMLESTKPPLPRTATHLHYLLATPFRYPPLAYGSRFGRAHEPSLFYGSRQINTALIETAYYRFVFWQGMRVPLRSARLITQHTAFGARYRTSQGLRLQAPPFDEYESNLRDPADYTATQALGTAMRKSGVQAIQYFSARTQTRALNVALYTPEPLISSKPLNPQAWLCETRAQWVSFRAASDGQFHSFPLSGFLIKGVLPHPAT